MNFLSLTSPCLAALGLSALFAGNASAQCQLAELSASDAGSGDRFGTAVDISGDLAIVGGPRNDDGASNAGSAYIYRFDGTAWVEEAKLLDTNPGSSYFFGTAVSIDGDVAIVGVPDDDDNGTRSGAVHVFRYDGANWNHEVELIASDVAANTRYGWDVDIDGDVFVVGAKENDEMAINNTGAVYVYRHNGLMWVEEQKLVASDAIINAQFGDAVAINGTDIIVGAWQDPDGAAFSVGAAYVFTFDGATWNEQQKLRASDSADFNFFGRSVDIRGDLAIAGADTAPGFVADSGAEYVFRRTGTVWAEEAKLFASDGEANDDYGNASAICEDGNGIAVGARSDNLGGTSAGSVYLYRNIASVWTEVDRLVSDDLGTGDDFGEFIAADGDRIIAGAKDNDSNGAAYIFSKGLECNPFPSSCNGDGGDQLGCTNCPCGNNASPGTVGGCLNSATTSSQLIATGDPSVSLPSGDTTDLRFALSGAPPTAFSILNSGDAVAPTGMANPCFGLDSGTQAAQFDGLRCAVMNTRRHGGRSADVNGDVGVTNNPWGGEGGPAAGLAVAGGGFAAGQTRFFQVIHRDDPLAVCLRGLNTTQAVSVTFAP